MLWHPEIGPKLNCYCLSLHHEGVDCPAWFKGSPGIPGLTPFEAGGSYLRTASMALLWDCVAWLPGTWLSSLREFQTNPMSSLMGAHSIILSFKLLLCRSLTLFANLIFSLSRPLSLTLSSPTRPLLLPHCQWGPFLESPYLAFI